MFDGNGRIQLATQTRKALPKIPAICEQWVRCGKAGCRCSEGHLHGPYSFLFWREQGRLRKKYVPQVDVSRVQDQIGAIKAGRDRIRQSSREAWDNYREIVARLKDLEGRPNDES